MEARELFMNHLFHQLRILVFLRFEQGDRFHVSISLHLQRNRSFLATQQKVLHLCLQ